MNPYAAVQAIPTKAFGCSFRSRTEARAALFFTKAGIPWEYEPEAYRTSAGGYLPDFRIRPEWASDLVWVEIKPPGASLSDPRWPELATGSGMIFLVLAGLHRTGDTCGRDHQVRVWHPGGLVADVPTMWTGREFTAAWNASSEVQFDRRAPAGRKGRRR